MRTRSLCAAGVLSLASVQVVMAGPITVSATSGAMTATATFERSGDLLVLRVQRAINGTIRPEDVLNSVFFELRGGMAVTPDSALLDGTATAFGPQGGCVVDGPWGYGAASGPASAGFRAMNNGSCLTIDHNLRGGDLSGPVFIGGPLPGDGGGTPFGTPGDRTDIVIAFRGITGDFDPSASVWNVSFEFGDVWTGPLQPRGAVVPMPSAAALGLVGLGIAASRRRRWVKI